MDDCSGTVEKAPCYLIAFASMWCPTKSPLEAIGVDLSKHLVANQNIGGKKVVKSDKCMGVSQLLLERARAVPQKSTPVLEANRRDCRPELAGIRMKSSSG